MRTSTTGSSQGHGRISGTKLPAQRVARSRAQQAIYTDIASSVSVRRRCRCPPTIADPGEAGTCERLCSAAVRKEWMLGCPSCQGFRLIPVHRSRCSLQHRRCVAAAKTVKPPSGPAPTREQKHTSPARQAESASQSRSQSTRQPSNSSRPRQSRRSQNTGSSASSEHANRLAKVSHHTEGRQQCSLNSCVCQA